MTLSKEYSERDWAFFTERFHLNTDHTGTVTIVRNDIHNHAHFVL